MGMDETRYEWDASFHHGSLVESVDGHTAILYRRLELDWFPTFLWPRDLCYTRYWRRNDAGSLEGEEVFVSDTQESVDGRHTLSGYDSEDADDFGTPHVSDDLNIPDLDTGSPPHKETHGAVSPAHEEPPAEPLDLSMFAGTLKHDDGDDGGRNCWSTPSGRLFRVRSKRFLIDGSKCPAGDPLVELVTVGWFKDTKRMDHLARRKGCAAQVAAENGYFTIAINMQVPGSTHYSMVFYFAAKKAIPKGSLLNRSSLESRRFGSWIVRQSVGSTPCILGKAVDCTYYRGSNYLENGFARRASIRRERESAW